MAPRERSQATERSSVPGVLPSANPPIYPSIDHSFTLQAVMELKGSMGELKQQVQHLDDAIKSQSDTIKEHGTEIKRIAFAVYAAGAILTIGVVIGGYLMNIAKDVIVEYLKLKHP